MDNASTGNGPAACYALHAPPGPAEPPGPATLLVTGVPGSAGPDDVRNALEKASQAGQLVGAAAAITTRLIFERRGELASQPAPGPASGLGNPPALTWDQLTTAAVGALPDGHVDYPVCDPALPARVQARIRRHQAITGYQLTGYQAEPTWDFRWNHRWDRGDLYAWASRSLMLAAVPAILWLAVWLTAASQILAIAAPRLTPAWLAAGLAWAGLVTVAAITLPLPGVIASRASRHYHHRYVDYGTLDPPGRQLLTRAQTASRAITSSRAAREHLLDDAAATLPGQLWDIAAQLRDLAAETSPQDLPAADTATALDAARASVTARITALEDTAAAAADLDRALHDADTAAAAPAALDRALDLAAHTAGNHVQATATSHAADRARHLAEEIRLQSDTHT